MSEPQRANRQAQSFSAEAELLHLGTATLGESGAARTANRLRPVWPGARVAGAVYTARCAPGDNLGIHVAVTAAPEQSVLVADMGGMHDFGYWGEVLTTAAEARGLLGLVIDGCVRDVDALQAHGFPVFSTGIALTGATKDQPALVGASATVGDVEVTTGAWVVADRDGVVVIQEARLDEIVNAARARQGREAALFEALRSGSTTVEQLGLDASLVTRR
jgi:4-hydroxy-4-methyl-2-oxoglutarate aldolase